MRLLKIILSFTVVFLTPLQAEPLQPLPGIEQAAYEHALNDAQASYSQPQVVVEPLDKRLRLNQCEQPLHTFSNSSANNVGNRTIGVKCQHPSEWTVYVPVSALLTLLTVTILPVRSPSEASSAVAPGSV